MPEPTPLVAAYWKELARQGVSFTEIAEKHRPFSVEHVRKYCDLHLDPSLEVSTDELGREPAESATGVLYALRNSSMPGLLKIGQTSGRAGDRASMLYTTGVPTPFEIAWCSRPLSNPVRAEAEAHAALAPHRISDAREFFRLGLDEAMPALNKVEARWLDEAWQARKMALEEARRRRARLHEELRQALLSEQAPVVKAWKALRGGTQVPAVWDELNKMEYPPFTLRDAVLLPFHLLTVPFRMMKVGDWDPNDRRRYYAEKRARRATAWSPLREVIPQVIWRQLAQCDWQWLDHEGVMSKHERALSQGMPLSFTEYDTAICWAPTDWGTTKAICGQPADRSLLGQSLCRDHAP